ncbi:MAG: Ppx/GppA family phosphatase [Paenibacillaceae bacterium]|jgi:exopolyphosphatase/guanosine-5'-triphosphate,3'-diphosphate pyrophosphatase|nr:Ppx/GppA family phosphatase [Paenibacillaceae bacterium]
MEQEQNTRIGIIDIGSNSIRLVIYEVTGVYAYRVIDENKESARLSGKIDQDGKMKRADMMAIVQTLNHFKMLCQANRANSIRAVATAAIRNAANSQEILDVLRQYTEMDIEILPGDEEARLGFLGMINTMDIQDGLVIDIGGGSTEVSLFLNRTLIHSISFTFGSVNTTKKYTKDGVVDQESITRIRQMVTAALSKEPWIKGHKGLPLIGLGGTIRTVCKLDQREKKYSLPLTHNYRLEAEAVDRLLAELGPMPVERRKKRDGMTSSRADIIVPGLIILQTVFEFADAAHYIVSGSGLRDGLFFESLDPANPQLHNVLEHSVRNLLTLHPTISLQHVEQVNRLALKLFDDMQDVHHLSVRSRSYLHVASLLYRIGVTVFYYDFPKHTFYLMAHSRLYGLSHREILICAIAASYKNKNRTRQMCLEYKDILTESDCQLIIRLGTLLQLAIGMDRSQTQPLLRLTAITRSTELELCLECRHSPAIELRELDIAAREFKKVWGLNLRIRADLPASTS